MLEEHEWREIYPLLRDRTEGGQAAHALFKEFTGLDETNPAAIWHHRLSLYGPPCETCGKPLRTLQAKLCGTCGSPREPIGEQKALQYITALIKNYEPQFQLEGSFMTGVFGRSDPKYGVARAKWLQGLVQKSF
jgi:hypothetical protein